MRLQPEQIGIRLGRPAGACQLQVRDDVATGAHEGLEQAEFGRGEGQGDVADARLMTAGFHHEIARRQRPTAGTPAAVERSTRRITALIRASSSALPNGFVR